MGGHPQRSEAPLGQHPQHLEVEGTGETTKHKNEVQSHAREIENYVL